MSEETKSLAIQIRLPADISTELEISSQWVESRNELVARSSEIDTVETEAEFKAAGALIRELTSTSNGAETMRKQMSTPYFQVHKNINAVAKEARQPLEDQKSRLQRLASGFANKKAAEKRAAEKAKQDAILKQVHETSADEKVEIDESLLPATVAAPAKSAHVRQKEVIDFVVVDPSAVKQKFLSVDESKIRKMVKEQSGWLKAKMHEAGGDELVVGGIKFTRSIKVVSRG